MRKKPTNPSPKIAKFVDMTCAACFLRQNPVSTSANPACMKTTRTAPITTHSRFSVMPSGVSGVADDVVEHRGFLCEGRARHQRDE